MNIKTTTKLVTFAIIPLLIFLVLAYDVYAIYLGTSEASISSLIISLSYEMPFMVYLIGLANGILVGHLFWRMKRNKDTKKIDRNKKKDR
jgi:hypothetical protein